VGVRYAPDQALGIRGLNPDWEEGHCEGTFIYHAVENLLNQKSRLIRVNRPVDGTTSHYLQEEPVPFSDSLDYRPWFEVLGKRMTFHQLDNSFFRLTKRENAYREGELFLDHACYKLSVGDPFPLKVRLNVRSSVST
jgi:hypothetical protein